MITEELSDLDAFAPEAFFLSSILLVLNFYGVNSFMHTLFLFIARRSSGIMEECIT